MTAKNDAKFEEELTCLFKIDTKIWHILTQPLIVSKICTLLGSFWPKNVIFKLKK